MTAKIRRVSSRGFAVVSGIALFALGAIVVLVTLLFPRIFGVRMTQGLLGDGIALADAPSCGSSCSDGCGGSSCGGGGGGGTGGGAGDGGDGGAGGDSSCGS